RATAVSAVSESHTAETAVAHSPVAPSPVEPIRPPVPSPAPAISKPGLALAEVESVLRAVVSEKTGYPPEMLELDMGLDADLGIDSIKRVEILSALQERLPSAPAVKPEHLGTLHTLRHIARFLAGTEAASAAPAAAPEATSPAT